MADEMWKIIRKKAPKAKLFQLLGNHDERPYKRLIEKAPELEPFIDLKSAWHFPKVETINDTKDELIIDGIVFIHGFRTKHGAHLPDYDYLHVTHAHTHRANIHAQRTGKLSRAKTAISMDVGYLANPFSEGLLYRASRRFFTWTHAVGTWDGHDPKLIFL